MKKDFSALHLQETATEAGTEITQDLYSSAPEYHLNTIHERLKKQPHACKATHSLSSCDLFLQVKLGVPRTDQRAVLATAGPVQVQGCCCKDPDGLDFAALVLTEPWQDTAQSHAGQGLAGCAPGQHYLQVNYSRLRDPSQRKLPPPPQKNKFLQDSDITCTSHLPDFQHLG